MNTSPGTLLLVLGIAATPANAIACATVENPVQAQPADHCNAPEPADGRITASQIETIMAWLADRFDLPRSVEPPAIVFDSPERLAQMRYGSFVAGRSIPSGAETEGQTGPGGQAGQGDVVALYNDSKRAIHLSQAWNGTSDASMSVLVHEMVHHLQNMAGLKYACTGEREKIAYQAQETWLKQSGKSLESEFGIDPLTLLVRSNCM